MRVFSLECKEPYEQPYVLGTFSSFAEALCHMNSIIYDYESKKYDLVIEDHFDTIDEWVEWYSSKKKFVLSSMDDDGTAEWVNLTDKTDEDLIHIAEKKAGDLDSKLADLGTKVYSQTHVRIGDVDLYIHTICVDEPGDVCLPKRLMDRILYS